MPTVNVRPGADPHMQEIADTLGKSKKVIVVTGAGISTNCGIPDFRSENGLYSLIQAQYDAVIHNPPWESKDDFDIDDRPKKKRRANDRWFYEIVYPEGKGPEDYLNLENQDNQRPQSLISPPTSEHDSPASTPACALSRTSSASQQQLDDNAHVDINNVPERTRCEATPIEDFQNSNCQVGTSTKQPPIETTIGLPSRDPEITDPLDGISLIPTPPPSLEASNPTPSDSSSEPSTPKDKSVQPRRITPKPLEFTTSSPLSSLPSSPVFPPGIQLGTPLPQSDNTCEPFDPPTLDPYSSHSGALQRGNSNCTSSQSDEEPTNPESSQASSRALRNFKGRDLFDSMVWADPYSTSIFYMFISSFRQKILQDVKSTSPTHKFIKSLRDCGRLVRNYTQNIDSLEEREGLATDLTLGPGTRARFQSKKAREHRSSDAGGHGTHGTGVECVQLHGSLVSLRCGLCSKISRWDEAERESTTLAGLAPDCPSCAEYSAKRTDRGRRGLAVGRLRPDIVLYGEEHPNASLVAPLITHDLALGPDVLLILGTSLKVHGLKIMVKEFAKAVHTKGGKVIFVNRTKPPESTWGDVLDYWVEWDCDAWVLDLKERRGDIWLPPRSSVRESKSKREPYTGCPKSKRDSVRSELKSKKEAAMDESREMKPTLDTKRKKPSRPQATRDDRMSGVYHTFKILDVLNNLLDDQGQQSTRSMYWRKPARASTASIPNVEPTAKKGAKPRSAQVDEKETAATNKKHKARSHGHHQKFNGRSFFNKQSVELRASASGLPAKTPEPPISRGRAALSEVKTNRSSPTFNFAWSPAGHYMKGASSYLPNLPGLSLPVEMGLVSHPPSGAALPLHSPVVASARGARHRTPADEEDIGDTIVVAPWTPKTDRIKRLGSLVRILSSSPEMYHDAEEEPGSGQEYHDAVE